MKIMNLDFNNQFPGYIKTECEKCGKSFERAGDAQIFESLTVCRECKLFLQMMKEKAVADSSTVSNFVRKKIGLKPLERGKYDRKKIESEK